MREVKFAERRISAERTEVVALSSDRFEIERRLDPSMRDAEREIAKYFQMQTAGLGYAVRDHDGSGKGQEAPEPTGDELKILIERMKDLKEWKEQCPSKARGVVLDVQVFGFDHDQVAYQRLLTVDDVVKLYIIGLKIYCKIRGWM